MSLPSITVAPAGIDPSTDLFIKSLLKLHKNSHGVQWNYLPVVSPAQLLDYVVQCPDDAVVLLDVDSNDGRLSWYTLRAMYAGTIGLVTSHPDQYAGEHVIVKPLRAGTLLSFFETALARADTGVRQRA